MIAGLMLATPAEGCVDAFPIRRRERALASFRLIENRQEFIHDFISLHWDNHLSSETIQFSLTVRRKVHKILDEHDYAGSCPKTQQKRLLRREFARQGSPARCFLDRNYANSI
jgi:hypothetical protein